ncbi:hypothetical protein ACFVU3_21105 [Streptomyces sp. NPDC058052]|uniref:hypothetical protein n=1 Tax=Streptomyces sp. NPDC058052 TaxID=3346316 RepID=UPI0036EB5575
MPSSFPPLPPVRPRAEQYVPGEHRTSGASLRDPASAVRRTYLLVNAVPLSIAIVLSCSAQIAEVQVHGRLTLGITWGLLQLGLLLGTTWWYENRATRLSERLGAGTGLGVPLHADEYRRCTR